MRRRTLKDSLNNVLTGAGSIVDMYGVGDQDYLGGLKKYLVESIRREKAQKMAEEISRIVYKAIVECVDSGEKLTYKKGNKTFQLISVEVK